MKSYDDSLKKKSHVAKLEYHVPWKTVSQFQEDVQTAHLMIPLLKGNPRTSGEDGDIRLQVFFLLSSVPFDCACGEFNSLKCC